MTHSPDYQPRESRASRWALISVMILIPPVWIGNAWIVLQLDPGPAIVVPIAMTVVGAIVGWFSWRRPWLGMMLCVASSIGVLFALLSLAGVEISAAMARDWTGAVYLVIPYIVGLLLPTVLAEAFMSFARRLGVG